MKHNPPVRARYIGPPRHDLADGQIGRIMASDARFVDFEADGALFLLPKSQVEVLRADDSADPTSPKLRQVESEEVLLLLALFIAIFGAIGWMTSGAWR